MEDHQPPAHAHEPEGPLERADRRWLHPAATLAAAFVALVTFTWAAAMLIAKLQTRADVEEVFKPLAVSAHDAGLRMGAAENRITALETDIQWLKTTLYSTARTVGAPADPPPVPPGARP